MSTFTPCTNPAGSICCAVMNVHSIVEKRFDLCAYLAAYQIDILAVTETFLDDSIHDSLVVPFGYVIYRHDRNRHGGGVLILVRSIYSVVRRSDLNLHVSSEILWIELVGQKQCPLIFGVLYRPPSASNNVLDQLYGTLCALTSSKCNIVLCGDFNVPNIDWNTMCPSSSSVAATTLCNIVADNYLSQVVLSPTHGINILDLVFTNFPGYFQSVESS